MLWVGCRLTRAQASVIGCCARSVSAYSTACTYSLYFHEHINHTKQISAAKSIHVESIQAINSLDFRVSESQKFWCILNIWHTQETFLWPTPPQLSRPTIVCKLWNVVCGVTQSCLDKLSAGWLHILVIFRNCKTHISQYTDASSQGKSHNGGMQAVIRQNSNVSESQNCTGIVTPAIFSTYNTLQNSRKFKGPRFHGIHILKLHNNTLLILPSVLWTCYVKLNGTPQLWLVCRHGWGAWSCDNIHPPSRGSETGPHTHEPEHPLLVCVC